LLENSDTRIAARGRGVDFFPETNIEQQLFAA